jgi:acetyl-CoA acetyltransferase
VVSFYDCFTAAVISQLEGFGFAPRGEGGPFVREGRIRLDGDTPVNTHGGMLSEAYIHGMNGVLEVVRQIRGHAGERQIPGAATGLASGFANTTGCAVVLGR